MVRLGGLHGTGRCDVGGAPGAGQGARTGVFPQAGAVIPPDTGPSGANEVGAAGRGRYARGRVHRFPTAGESAAVPDRAAPARLFAA
ncbi:hypothetical protein GCM10009834_36460 [Streptomonospora arabica]